MFFTDLDTIQKPNTKMNAMMTPQPAPTGLASADTPGILAQLEVLQVLAHSRLLLINEF